MRDGVRVITGSGDGALRLWELATGRELAALRGPDRIVTSVVEVPDGVMASYYKGAVLRWNLTSRASDEPLQAGDNVDVTTIAVTPNGRYLVTGGSDIKFLAIIPLTNPY